MLITGSAPCAVHELDFLYCRYDAAYRACFEFSDGSRCRVRLCADHFAQMWAIAEFVAERRDVKVVSVRADVIRKPKAKASRSKAARHSS
jgi:hypothetical protein